MRFTRVAPLVLIVAGVLTGCTAAPAPDAPTPSSTAIAVDETCAQLSDVKTLINNLSLTRDQGRLLDAEWYGALTLAARMLQRIDVEPGTPIETKLAALQDITPTTGDATFAGYDPASPEWIAAYQEVALLCGENYGTSGWVGG